MKYTIEGLQQKVLLEYRCDAEDAVILRFVIDFFNSGAMKIIEDDDGEVYFWVHYDTIITEIPIIGIKKQALRDRFDKYVEAGLMKKKVVKNNKGSYTYFGFNKLKYEAMVREKVCTGSEIPLRTGSEIPVRTGSPLHTKDSSTNLNSSTNKYFMQVFDAWSERKELFKHAEKTVIANVKKNHIRIVEDIGIEESIKAVNNYADILASKDHYFKYKWTFWDFIARGIYKFLDEADPFKSFSSKKELPVDEEKRKFLEQLKEE